MKVPHFIFKVLIVCFFALFLLSCGNDDEKDVPGVCFEVTEGDLYAEVGVSFDASCSDSVQVYMWDFGDGDFGTGVKVSHVYDEAGDYEVSLSAGDDQNTLKTLRKTITVQPSPFIKHCGTIEGAEVWEEGMHLIQCNVTVNGSLTIKPGASVYVQTEKSLKIHGTLIAQGTAAKPIKFTPANNSTTPGSWGYIRFMTGSSSESIMEFCEVAYGGDAGFNGYPNFEYASDYGMIHLEECKVSIKNTTIKGAGNFGISLSENAQFSSFENNVFTSNEDYPVSIHAKGVHTIGQTSTFSGADIRIIGEEYLHPGADVTWYKQDVPYFIDGSIGLQDHNITIEAGTVIKFESNDFFNVGYFSTGAGSITAIGTASEPIIFTSSKEVKNKGDWAGLLISTNSVLRHCVIEYAGSDYTISGHNRALYVTGTNAIVTNSIIQESSGYGIEMNATAATMSNNLIKNCDAYGVMINVKDYQLIDNTNTIENTDGFYVHSGSGFNQSTTLEKRAYPYVMHGLSFFNNATLTIEPGAEIQVRSGGSLTMGYDNVSNSYSGNLIANGTAENPIKFSLYSKDKEAGNGNWGSIVFGELSTTSVLNHCILTDGGHVVDGNNNTYSDMGMIHCYKTNGFPTITNCTLTNSDTYGITLENGATITSSDNTFSNNASGDTFSY